MDTEGQRALGVSLREAFKIEKKCEIFHFFYGVRGVRLRKFSYFSFY